MIDFDIHSAQSMQRAIHQLGIVPFVDSAIPGFSVKDLTKAGFWIGGDEDPLGPWDWKIDCVLSGNIAYGKFLCGGKAAFATIPMYAELVNIRRATTKPDAKGQAVMDKLNNQDSITVKEVRAMFDVKKAVADAIITKLQHQCRIVVGAIERIYTGSEQTYKGWQHAYFCRPETLFGSAALKTNHTPDESLQFLADHIASITNGSATRKQILKVLK